MKWPLVPFGVIPLLLVEAVIESFQPFNTKGGAATSTLLMISELNNADKHRLIQIGAFRSGNVGRRVEIRGYLYRNRPPPGLTFMEVNDLTEFQQGAFPTDGGAFGRVHRSVIERWPDISHMPVTSDFVFAEGCDAVKGLPLVELLRAMIRHYEHIVARSFLDAFAPYPEEWSETTIGPLDDKSELSR